MTTRPNLRLIFVQMLFALAIGQLALKCGDLVIQQCDFSNYYYAYSHLCLAAIILSASWIGWQASGSNTDANLSNYVVSWEFIIMLLDIFLVIAYFIIVRGVEITPERGMLLPNSSIELSWSTIIFTLYILWDIITKGRPGHVVFKSDSDASGVFIKSRESDKDFWISILPTLYCFCLSLTMYWYLDANENAMKTTLIDCMLIILFITFRGWKQEVKEQYHLPDDQISSKNREVIKLLNPKVSYPISVKERHFKLKFFIIRILPIVIFYGLFIVYLLT